MLKLIQLSILLVFTSIIMSGCGAGTIIQNVPTQHIAKSVTEKNMDKAIYRAATARGWVPQKISNGIMDVTYAKRGFSVTATVTYTAKKFRIDYKTSQGLKYNPTTGTIHKNYNSWIQNLKKQIEMEIKLIDL